MTESLIFTNPATGESFGEVEMSTPEAVQKAVDDMRKAFPDWSKKIRQGKKPHFTKISTGADRGA